MREREGRREERERERGEGEGGRERRGKRRDGTRLTIVSNVCGIFDSFVYYKSTK
jgi:hypothetical protein